MLRRALIGVLVLGVIGALAAIRLTTARSPSEPLAISVPFVEASAGIVRQEVRTQGVVASRRELTVSAAAAGSVVRAPFTVGSNVAKGELLFRLNAEDLDAEIEIRKRSVEALEIELAARAERVAVLRRDWQAGGEALESVRQEERLQDQARARLAISSGELANVQSRRRSLSVHSPADGTIVQLMAQPGEYVPLGGPLALLSLANSLQILARVDPIDAWLVESSQPTTISIDGGGLPPIQSRVVEIEPRTRPQGKGESLAVWIALPTSLHQLRAGQPVDVRIIVRSTSAAVRIPIDALDARDTASFVWAISAERLNRVPVSVGLRGDTDVEILSGISAGQRVALVQGRSLSDGARAIPVNASSGPR